MKVEIKETVSDAAVDLAGSVLEPAGAAPTERRIFFSEVRVPPDAPLVLAARGLLLRSRRASGAGDVAVKLRGPYGCLDTDQWSERSDHWDGAKLEGDWAGAKRLLSASLDHNFGDGADEDPVDAGDVRSSLSHDQRALAEMWMDPLDTLDPLGPIQARKWSTSLTDAGLDCDVEVWTLHELRFLEVSTRVKDNEAETVQRDLHHSLVKLGLPESVFAESTKTEAVLRRLMQPKRAA